MTASPQTDFARRYGPWSLVAGGSEGLGASLAAQAAARGLDIVLVARSQQRLDETARNLRGQHGCQVRTIAADLTSRQAVADLFQQTADLEVGLLLCNAALAPIGRFLEQDAEIQDQTVALNCLATQAMVHHYGNEMVARRRGGILLMSSMASFQGTALVAHYAATKAYLRVLAEGLWQELRPMGVDVLASCPGPIDTPAFRRTKPRLPLWLLPRPASPDLVARQTLDALGRGPVVIPQATARLTARLTRLLPGRLQRHMVSAGTKAMYNS